MTAKKSTIFAIDDMPENLDFLYGILHEKYEIKVATNGKKALELLKNIEPPDLFLLDIEMPEMDGYETIREFHKNPINKKIPVIFLTSKDDVTDIVKGFELGAVDYIAKPINPPEVLARVINQLELKYAREKLEIQNKELITMAKLREDIEKMTSHDLKSPLSVILGTSQLLKKFGNLNDQNYKKINLIESAGYRMLHMINRSLDLIKMEKGIYKFEVEPVNVHDILNKIKIDTNSICELKKIELAIFLNEKPVSERDVFIISGENLLFYTMLSNLITNAIEASPKRKKVNIQLNSNDFLMIGIHNMGTVPLEIRDKFFNKYVTSGKKEGTGLGTYSSRLIAENMNGSITMSSSRQDGTLITIKFPKS